MIIGLFREFLENEGLLSEFNYNATGDGGSDLSADELYDRHKEGALEVAFDWIEPETRDYWFWWGINEKWKCYKDRRCLRE